MRNGKTLAAMLIVGGGLSAALAAPNAALASCGAYTPRQETPSFSYKQEETPEQREARLAEQKAQREARKAARLAKKEAKAAAAAAAAAAQQSTAVASN